MASDSVLNTKSYAFAIRIVKLSQLLQKKSQSLFCQSKYYAVEPLLAR